MSGGSPLAEPPQSMPACAFGTVQPAPLPSICTRLPNLDRVFPGMQPGPSIPMEELQDETDSHIPPLNLHGMRFNASVEISVPDQSC